MTGEIEQGSSNPDRQKTLIKKQNSPSPGNKKVRYGEVVGGTTAECAAICCCCPCGLMNLLILVIYKLPAGILRKALKIRKRKMKKKRRLLGLKNSSTSSGTAWTHNCDCYETELQQQVQTKKKQIDSLLVVSNESTTSSDGDNNSKMSKEELELEEEMWYRFHGAGFWRSPSQVSQRKM